MAKGTEILTDLVKEINSEGLFLVSDSQPGNFSPSQRPEIILRPGDLSYAEMRDFLLGAYTAMAIFLRSIGDHFEPELYFGPRTERKIALGFEWMSLEIDLFELQKESLWFQFMDEYYTWSAHKRYSLISGKSPQTL